MAATVHHASSMPSNMPVDPAGKPCFGCSRPIDGDQHGLVISLRDSLWHMDCFVCSSCKRKVHPDMTLLILADGSPVCMDCTYQCAQCKEPIQDEAVMTGDLTYHSACFKCQSCHRKIEDLVFAKTSVGIYCMPCHNEKAARSRRAIEKKRSKKRRDRPEGESPVPPLPSRSSSVPLSSGTSASSTPTSATVSSMTPNGIAPLSSPASSAHTSYNSSVHTPNGVTASPTSTHFYTPTSTPFLDTSAEFPSAKRASFSLEAGITDNTPRPRKSYQPPPASPTPSRGAPALSTNSLDEFGRSSSSSSPSSAGIGLGMPVPSLGASLTATSGGSSGLANHPHRRSMQPGAFLSSDMAGLQRHPSNASSHASSPRHHTSRSLSPIHPGTSILQRSTSPANSASPASFHSANHASSPDVGGRDDYVRTPSPSLLPPSLHTFPPSHHTTSRSREPSPARSVLSSQRASIDEDVPPTPPPKVRIGSRLGPQAAKHDGAESDWQSSEAGEEMIINGGATAPPEGDYPEEVDYRLSDDLDGDESDSRAPERPPYDEERPESEESSDIEPEEKTQLAAPALPPMRFSLYGTDFSDLLRTVTASDSSSTISRLAESIEPASAPAAGAAFLTAYSGSDGRTGDSSTAKDGSPNGLTHFVTSPSDDHLVRSGSASAPPSSTTFVNGNLPPPSSVHSPWISFSPSDMEAAEEAAEEEDVLAPLSAVSMSGTSFVSATPSTSGSGLIPSSSSPEPSMSWDVFGKLQEAIDEAQRAGQAHASNDVRLDLDVALRLLAAVESAGERYDGLKAQYDGVKRKSLHYANGFNVAGAEYDREVEHRKEVEAEVARLRLLVSEQAVRLATLEAPERASKLKQSQENQLKMEMDSLQRRVSQLRVERDVVSAEVEQLAVSKSAVTELTPVTEEGTHTLSLKASRSLSQRLEEVKEQYSRDLEALQQQRESLIRELRELEDARAMCLVETAALQARNEELLAHSAQALPQGEPRADAVVSRPPRGHSARNPSLPPPAASPMSKLRRADESFASVTTTMTSTSGLTVDDKDDSEKFVKVGKADVADVPTAVSSAQGRKFRWYGKSSMNPSASRPSLAQVLPPAPPEKPAHVPEKPAHVFQQHSILRLTRCEYCSEKMWGLHVRCTTCGVVSHARCQTFIKSSCHRSSLDRQPASSDSTVFGRDLTEQVRADAKEDRRLVPVIVEKCIDALEIRGMDYEGIYRKTGGSSQCRNITQLFEKGPYDSFDLSDPDFVNDVSSITSVLKSYFRALPVPLFTFALHEAFISAGETSDLEARGEGISSLIQQLPLEHYETLKYLMLHLHRVTNLSEMNRMNSQNLGVVFGPTLMRSQDRAREFSDMSGETQTVRWLIDHAPIVFAGSPSEA